MFRKSAWIFFLLLLHGFLGADSRAAGDGFLVPILSDAGVKIGDVRGTRAEIMPHGDVVQLQGVCVRLFDVSGKAQVVIGGTEAVLSLSRQEISGDEFVHVAGELFTALSTRWKIYGPGRRVVMGKDVRVFFETGIDPTDNGEWASDGRHTLITDASLEILFDSSGTVFNFNDRTEVLSGDFTMTCNSLKVWSLPGEISLVSGQPANNGKIQKIDAHGNVSAFLGERSFRANSCEIYPEEGVIIFSGNVRIEDKEDTAMGEKFLLRNGLCREMTDAANVELPTFAHPESAVGTASRAASQKSR
jgi:hypothetical protein